MKTPKKVEEKVEVEVPETKFDGMGEIFVTGNNLQTVAVKRKIYLSSDEVKKFMGDNDPNLYFKGGVIPMYVSKTFGRILEDEDEEVKVMKEIFKGYDGLLMFKHRQQNLYTILVPKTFCAFELDANGDFVEDSVKYDIRTVNFAGGSTPSSFERGYFQKYAEKIKSHFVRARQKNAGFI